jgi:hypothetical protein
VGVVNMVAMFTRVDQWLFYVSHAARDAAAVRLVQSSLKAASSQAWDAHATVHAEHAIMRSALSTAMCPIPLQCGVRLISATSVKVTCPTASAQSC